MAHELRYHATVTWTGNTGTGTSAYGSYTRWHEIAAPGKPVIVGSSAPEYRGDADRYNPEELLVAALSTCHMLWYLHLCAEAGLVVTSYVDDPEGSMDVDVDGNGSFKFVVLRPLVLVTLERDMPKAVALHDQAHDRCFIANSVRFSVRHEPSVRVANG